jgi:ankyrin repeat protein
VRHVLARGMDPNACTPDGRTLLHLAVSGGHVPVLRTLLASGADVNAVDRLGLSPLALALAREEPACSARSGGV